MLYRSYFQRLPLFVFIFVLFLSSFLYASSVHTNSNTEVLHPKDDFIAYDIKNALKCDITNDIDEEDHLLIDALDHFIQFHVENYEENILPTHEFDNEQVLIDYQYYHDSIENLLAARHQRARNRTLPLTQRLLLSIPQLIYKKPAFKSLTDFISQKIKTFFNQKYKSIKDLYDIHSTKVMDQMNSKMLSYLSMAKIIFFPQLLLAEDFTFEQIKQMVLEHNQGLASVRREVDIASAQVKTQAAYPNPEVEAIFGYMNTRQPTGKYITPSGNSYSLGLTQPLDAPWTRSARIEVAEKGIALSQAQVDAFKTDLIALVKQRFYHLLKRQDEYIAAKEARSVVEEIKTKVSKRVEVGESAKYELIKAEAELLNAQKEEQSAWLKTIQAKAELKSLIHTQLPEEFGINAQWSAHSNEAMSDLKALVDDVIQQNPLLRGSKIAVEQADKELDYEKILRVPTLGLRVAQDQDPTMLNTRVGVILDLPIWNFRSGQIEQAQYKVFQKQNQLENQTKILSANMEVAYRQYEIAQNQVNALKNGILREAEAALKVAQASYQYGERGILDYLDAQRVLRVARSELINALYELEVALIEIQRLRARI
jgi:cobalt-zinc-cadmium efflux system outer membrane protein